MLIKNKGKYHLSERERAWLVGDMLSAGGNTTSTTLHWWLLALLAHPEVQVRAQAELDDVVGSARPPTFADLPFLPYIRAMVKEALRWSPTAPFGVPRASSVDDWYEGMFIPKGTIILPTCASSISKRPCSVWTRHVSTRLGIWTRRAKLRW
ncbi:cytochrome P450 [Lactarius hengduanensis]|nr:cytochrome P450 [Lactarius hengduanensis]